MVSSRCRSPLLLALFVAVVVSSGPGLAQDDAVPLPTPPAYSASGVNAYLDSRLSNIEEQLRSLTGKTEQLDYALRRLDQATQRFQTDVDARLTKLETAPPPAAPAPPAPPPQAKPPVPPPAPEPTEETAPSPKAPPPTPRAESKDPHHAEPSPVKGTLGALTVQGEKVTGAIKSPKSPPLPDTPADYGLTPQEQYDRAFGLLRQANYAEAEKSFKGFIEKNPKDKLIDNAKYWHAETFYVRARFSESAVAFGEAFEENPKGSKAPDSLLKLAMSLAALEKTADACATLSAMKEKFPSASPNLRSRADQERSRLKCGSKKP